MLFLSFIFNAVLFHVSLEKEKREKDLDKDSEFKDFAIDDILNNIQVIKTFGTEQKEINAINKMIVKNSDS